MYKYFYFFQKKRFFFILQIFDTERIASKSHNWHKKCFNCIKCSTTLNTKTHHPYEGADSEIYCKSCFKKSFPNNEMPKIFNDTTIIKPAEPEGGCPRCDGAVFQAEEVNIKGRMYHKKCLSCKQCKRLIDISLIAVGRYFSRQRPLPMGRRPPSLLFM